MPPTRTTPPASRTRMPKTADERVNFLLSDYDRVTKSLESAKRQLRFHKLTYGCSLAIMALDSWFSFNVLYDAGGSIEMAAGLTLLILATQWQINRSIFSRRIAHMFTLDRDRNGSVSPSEWCRWGFVLTIVVSAYALNVGTNMIGVDSVGLGSLIFSVPGVPQWPWLAALTAFFFATLLCFGDELINILADDNVASLKRRIPDLQNQQAVLDGRVREAQAFREQLLANAEEQGARRGASYQI